MPNDERVMLMTIYQLFAIEIKVQFVSYFKPFLAICEMNWKSPLFALFAGWLIEFRWRCINTHIHQFYFFSRHVKHPLNFHDAHFDDFCSFFDFFKFAIQRITRKIPLCFSFSLVNAICIRKQAVCTNENQLRGLERKGRMLYSRMDIYANEQIFFFLFL